MSDITTPEPEPTTDEPAAAAPADDQPETTAAPADDAGQAEAQALMDEATDRGYLGAKVDPAANEEYSLESGPDSPQLPDDRTRA